MRAAEPEVVFNQLTSLPERYNPRSIDYGPTNRVRHEGGANLMKAALAMGARRYVTQSIAFLYAPEGDPAQGARRRDPSRTRRLPSTRVCGRCLPTSGRCSAPRASRASSSATGSSTAPAPTYDHGGGIEREVAKRRLPLIGPATGLSSFIHVEDAASATVAALDRGAPGVYNVCDDEPAAMREWLPVYAEAAGRSRPLRVPTWLARLAGGRMAVEFGVNLRGATNAKAKRELGWQPRYASWRQGFPEALG